MGRGKTGSGREHRMSGEEIYNLLVKMAGRGDTPRKRERQLRKIADRLRLSSDALRAKARRYAQRQEIAYPLMRAEASHHREEERGARRNARAKSRDRRIKVGKAALAKGATWTDLAGLFGISTPEGAAQWWRRNTGDARKRVRGGTRRKG